MNQPLALQPELLLDNQLCFKLYAASRAVVRGYRPMLDQLGLTYPQYLVMLVLWEWQVAAPAQPTVKALGKRLMLDSGTLTPLLKRLQQLGLIERRRATHDEREVHLHLTGDGVAMRQQVKPLRDQLLCSSGLDLDQMVELRAQLADLLDRFMPLHGDSD
jgi:DNA-binding MarR family transcriptional regulator